MAVQAFVALNRRLNKKTYLILIDTQGGLGAVVDVTEIKDEHGNTWEGRIIAPRTAYRMCLRVKRISGTTAFTTTGEETGTLTITLDPVLPVDPVQVIYVDDDPP